MIAHARLLFRTNLVVNIDAYGNDATTRELSLLTVADMRRVYTGEFRRRKLLLLQRVLDGSCVMKFLSRVCVYDGFRVRKKNK